MGFFFPKGFPIETLVDRPAWGRHIQCQNDEWINQSINEQQTAMTESSTIFKETISKQISDFSTFAEFTWDIETENLRRTYLIIVFSQFIYCASIWYVFTEKHDFKQKEKKTIKFLTDIQTRKTQIIAKAFKFISDTALKIELHLFSIRQQFDVFIYDTLLRIIINLIYEHIRSQKRLSDRAWMFEATQHQRILYV